MGIVDVIKSHERVMCDTAPIIYLIEDHTKFGKAANEFFKYATKNNISIYSSVITLSEVLTLPLKENRLDLVKKFREFLINSSNFTLYPIDAVIAEKAAELRSQYSIKTPDAMQLAVGIENSASLFLTNDNSLKNIKEIEVVLLSDYN